MSNNINDLFHFRSQKRTQQQSTVAHARSHTTAHSKVFLLLLLLYLVCVYLFFLSSLHFWCVCVCVDAFSSFDKNLLCWFFFVFSSSFKYMFADEFRPNGITRAAQFIRNIRYPCTHTHIHIGKWSRAIHFLFCSVLFAFQTLSARACVCSYACVHACVCAPSIFNGISAAVSELYLFNFRDHKTYCYIFFVFCSFLLGCNVSVWIIHYPEQRTKNILLTTEIRNLYIIITIISQVKIHTHTHENERIARKINRFSPFRLRGLCSESCIFCWLFSFFLSLSQSLCFSLSCS